MQDIYLGRQPIYNRQLQAECFELFYRHCAVDSAVFDDAELATSRVILNTLTEVGLTNVVGQRPAFINVARNFIIDGGLNLVNHPQLIFEVVGDIDLDPALLTALGELRAEGRRFAVDHFRDNAACRALLAVADYVKLDLLDLDAAQLRRLAPELRRQGLVLVGQRIETAEALALCQELDFDYFQGYYFSQPRLLKFRSIPTNQLALLHLIGKLNDPDTSIETIEQLIAQDVSLSYKLLRHINSAYFGLKRQVDSIQRAVLLLGVDHVRAWATLISLANMDSARSELANTALIRAKMCQQLAIIHAPALEQSGFTVGLLSILDVLTESPMEQAIESLPLAAEINQALIAREGSLGRILDCTLAYERGDWQAVDASGFEPNQVSDAYFAALTDAYRTALERM